MPSETNGEKPNRNGFVTGEWTVAPSRNLLVRGHEQVRVEPRVMDVLVHLAERAEERALRAGKWVNPGWHMDSGK